MNKVIGGRDTSQGVVQRIGLKDVSANDLRLLGRTSRQRLGSPHHAAHRSPRLLELPQQAAADITGRPGDQNAARCLLHPRRYRVAADSHASPLCCSAARNLPAGRRIRHARIAGTSPRPRRSVASCARAPSWRRFPAPRPGAGRPAMALGAVVIGLNVPPASDVGPSAPASAQRPRRAPLPPSQRSAPTLPAASREISSGASGRPTSLQRATRPSWSCRRRGRRERPCDRGPVGSHAICPAPRSLPGATCVTLVPGGTVHVSGSR